MLIESEKSMTKRPSRVENDTKKEGGSGERRGESKCADEHANVLKLRSRSEAERTDSVLHEIRKTCVTISTLAFTISAWKGHTWTSYSPPPPGLPSPFTSYCQEEENSHSQPAALSLHSTASDILKAWRSHLLKHGVILHVCQKVGLDPALGQIKC